MKFLTLEEGENSNIADGLHILLYIIFMFDLHNLIMYYQFYLVWDLHKTV